MNIMIAEDEHDIAMQYKIALEERHHHVTIAEDGEECLKAYRNALGRESEIENGSPFDVVVLDYRMPKKDGMEVAKEILELNPHQRIIFASAYVKETLVDSVKQLKQVVELIQKPFELDVLVDTIENKEAYAELEKLNVKLNFSSYNENNLTSEQIEQITEALGKILKVRAF